MNQKSTRENIKKILENSLLSEVSEVICVSGKWGTGKTTLWREVVSAVGNKQAFKFRSYVSLFGLNSIREIKTSIFDSAESKDGKKISISDFSKNDILGYAENSVNSLRSVAKYAEKIPILKQFVPADMIMDACFLSLSKHVICFDDLERMGRGLNISDILGLISFLKEEKKCKIIILLNEDQIVQDQKTSYVSSFEKVVDKYLRLDISPSDATKIVADIPEQFSRIVLDRCEKINLTNIRVIQRISYFLNIFSASVSKFGENAKNALASSVVLFCWSRFCPNEAPADYFVINRREILKANSGSGEKLSSEFILWNAVLEKYEFGDASELDKIVHVGVSTGIFDVDRVISLIKDIDDKHQRSSARLKMGDAWRNVFCSISDGEMACNKLMDTYMENITHVSVSDMEKLMVFFKDIDSHDYADIVFDKYKKSIISGDGSNDKSKIDRKISSVKDQDLREFLESIYEDEEGIVASRESVVKQAVIDIRTSSYGDEFDILCEASVEEYKHMIESCEAEELPTVISHLFYYDAVINASDKARKIADRAREAMAMIAGESKLKKIQMESFGINFEIRN